MFTLKASRGLTRYAYQSIRIELCLCLVNNSSMPFLVAPKVSAPLLIVQASELSRISISRSASRPRSTTSPKANGQGRSIRLAKPASSPSGKFCLATRSRTTTTQYHQRMRTGAFRWKMYSLRSMLNLSILYTFLPPCSILTVQYHLLPLLDL